MKLAVPKLKCMAGISVCGRLQVRCLYGSSQTTGTNLLVSVALKRGGVKKNKETQP